MAGKCDLIVSLVFTGCSRNASSGVIHTSDTEHKSNGNTQHDERKTKWFSSAILSFFTLKPSY